MKTKNLKITAIGFLFFLAFINTKAQVTPYLGFNTNLNAMGTTKYYGGQLETGLRINNKWSISGRVGHMIHQNYNFLAFFDPYYGIQNTILNAKTTELLYGVFINQKRSAFKISSGLGFGKYLYRGDKIEKIGGWFTSFYYQTSRKSSIHAPIEVTFYPIKNANSLYFAATGTIGKYSTIGFKFGFDLVPKIKLVRM